ncbi:MAG: DUF4321 domain-containing protein [Calditrichae bacterium]|nr:DUF4321 domain-containing protein [Calditrichia bacterium]NIW78219.1 DUF4321 domain-containing protein [Calditrichia bacterium]
MKKKSLAYYLFILILGALVGSVLGDALGVLLPQGVVREFFLKSAQFSFGPAPIDLRIVGLTFGFSISINVVGVLGILLIAYVLRWIE